MAMLKDAAQAMALSNRPEKQPVLSLTLLFRFRHAPWVLLCQMCRRSLRSDHLIQYWNLRWFHLDRCYLVVTTDFYSSSRAEIWNFPRVLPGRCFWSSEWQNEFLKFLKAFTISKILIERTVAVFDFEDSDISTFSRYLIILRLEDFVAFPFLKTFADRVIEYSGIMIGFRLKNIGAGRESPR